ncbi:MAG: S-adenosylmethionine:tRNA ribosyltransferase-isomerase, partial [Rectinemataceae bacterium]
ARGIRRTTVTLHVGLGTFLPVRTEIVEQHRMHEEWYTVSSETAALVNEAKREGRPVLAVGTTSLRTLESAWVDASADPGLSPGIQPGTAIRPGTGSTSIFIYPGYRFRAVDKLFTNFHTPKSTLLMLVSAFAGKEKILDAYAEAVRLGYRFFSYGDAMLIR